MSTTATTQLAIAPAVKAFRSYATATATKTKPKSKSTTKKAPAKKTATRKTAAKKPVKKPVKKAVKKPVKKTVAKRKAVKKTAVKKKAIKKPAPKRKPLTERQKMLKEKAKVRENIVQLKAAALQEPKKLATSAWAIFLGQFFRNHPQGDGVKLPEMTKKAAAEFKNISPSEQERLNKEAADNSKRNQEAHKKWLNSYTPQQIYEANRARGTLKRKLASYKKGKINDDRLVKGPKSAYVFFFMEKQGSMEGRLAERAKQVGQEWNALPAAQKQKYEDISRQESQRYAKEYKSIYGEEPQFIKKAA